MHFTPCTHLHNDIHIDHGIEEQTQEQPTDRGARGPEPYPRQEDLRQAADSAPDDTNPSEEGMEFLFAPVLAGELVIIGSDRSHVMAWGRHRWA
ncbi:hypothetical protein U9M48_008369 [Paspalum notatum var. saurae]|uniref:Uncharacterized protein n=1 Tax=Paspalum notatum var. saurae TaxID=547442 RepID=A0AAQ3SNT7_PASNO